MEQKSRGTLSTKATIAFEEVLGDFKRNESLIFSKMDQIKNNAGSKKSTGMGAAVEATEEIRKWEEHMWNLDKLLQKFNTSKDTGLSTKQADELFKQLGENSLTERAGTPWYILLLHEFTGFFALLLWAGSILCFIGYGLDNEAIDNLFLGIILVLVIIITGLFSFSQ